MTNRSGFSLLACMLMIVSLLGCSSAPKGDAGTAQIRIKLTVPEDEGRVYITGNVADLGPWDPAGLALEGDGLHREATLVLPVGWHFEYKFTAGSWEREELGEDGTPGVDRSLHVSGNEVIDATVPRFRRPDVEVGYPSPERFESAIAAFEAEEDVPMGGIVVAGSSSVRIWHQTIQEDLAPLTIVARGFGGSMVNDVLYNAQRIIIPHAPRAVVLYIGENDIAHGVYPSTVVGKLRQLVELLRTEIPGVRVYLVAQKPSPSRMRVWEGMHSINLEMERMAEGAEDIVYIDIVPVMLDDSGNPDPALFIGDMLHMNRQGYEAWLSVIRPALMEGELSRE